MREGSLTLPQLVQHYIEREQAHRTLNSYIEVFADEAMQSAIEIEQKMKAGTAGRLAGMVIGIKDNICYKDHNVSAASGMLRNYNSVFSSTAVERLVAEDAIILGRLNCDEFAMGGSNENSVYGPVRNPYNRERVAGGSSGGSAAAVAAGLCLAALGSDTGGSIRQPASFCGVVGLKPTYGRVSRWGLIAYASSFDQIGTLTLCADDAALLLEVMAGADGRDATASSSLVDDYTTFEKCTEKYSIAHIDECLHHPALSPDVKSNFETQLDTLRSAGHVVQRVSFPLLKHMVPAYYILTTAEASSNLSRYNGVFYGHRSPSASHIVDLYTQSRSEGFGAEVKRRIMLGTFVLSAGYHDAYYTRAQKVRRLIYDATARIFEKFDLIVGPTTPRPAFGIGEIADPVTMYLEDIFTVHANLAGLPAISIPTGQSKNLPLGTQFMAPVFCEKRLLAIANQLMRQ